LKKKGLLILLVLIFLCACTFIQKEEAKTSKTSDEALLLNQLDDIVKEAEKFANVTGTTGVQEVFQDQQERIWKIQFTDGIIVLYDEKTDEFVHAE
jgi:outer membrane biogenesis lipoprotein LolB